jgi:signal transduction histidine kinase
VTSLVRRDVVSAVVLVALGILLIALGVTGFSSPLTLPGWDTTERSPWWHLIPLLVGGVALLFERRTPLTAWLVGTLCFIGDLAIGGSLAVVLIWWDLLYAVGLYASKRARTTMTVAMVAITVVIAFLAAENAGSVSVFVLMALQVGALVLVPLWWAWGVRQGHELAAVAGERARLEAERAETLERINDRDRAEAVAAERTAMARDLHDVISSHLSAIAIHSAAALAGPADSERDRAALAQVRAASLESRSEMRTMISLLRSEGPAEQLATGGGMSTLPDLVRWASDAGLSIEVTAAGPIRPGVVAGNRALPTVVDQSALRIVREALTNALKHGPGTASLAIDQSESALTVEVANPLLTASADTAVAVGSGLGHLAGGGTGLISMRERVHALGGTFTSGPVDGRWVVRASLPIDREVAR